MAAADASGAGARALSLSRRILDSNHQKAFTVELPVIAFERNKD